MPSPRNATTELLRMGTAAGRGLLVTTVLGSGVTFLDSTIVNVALPVMDKELSLGVSGAQWVVSGYLVVLSVLMLFGGALGDVYGRRRVYSIGVALFGAASLACAVSPSATALIIARLFQGAAAALMVPAALAMLQTLFVAEDRGSAIGKWTGWSSILTAAAPLVGGGFVTFASWRWAFAVNVPLCVLVLMATYRWVPESRSTASATTWRHKATNILPLSLFRRPVFVWVNLCTVIVYGAFGSGLTFVGVRLQVGLGYSPLEASVATLPVSFLMLLLAGRFGAYSSRVGPRLPMTIGITLIALGLTGMGFINPGDHYLFAVLLPVLVWGFGLSMTVAPLTATALNAAPDDNAGAASAFNNTASRLGQAVGVAVLPVLAGFGGAASLGGPAFAAHFGRALFIAAGIALVGAMIAAFTLGTRNTGTAYSNGS